MKILIILFCFISYIDAKVCDFLTDKNIACVNKYDEQDELRPLLGFGYISGNTIKFTRVEAFQGNAPELYAVNAGIVAYHFNNIYKHILRFYSKKGKMVNEVILPGEMLALSPNGKYVLVEMISPSRIIMLEKHGQQYIEKYSIKTQIINKLYGSEKTIASFSSNSKYFAYVNIIKNKEKTIYIITIALSKTGKTIKNIIVNERVTTIAISPDNKFLAYGTQDGKVVFLSFGDWKEIENFNFSGVINHIIFSRDNKYFAINNSGDIRICSLENFNLIKRKVRTNYGDLDIVFTPDSSNIFVIDWKGKQYEFINIVD